MIFCMLSFSPFMLGAFVKVAHSLSLSHFLRSLAVFLSHALGFCLFLSHCPSSPSAPPPLRLHTHTRTCAHIKNTHKHTHSLALAFVLTLVLTLALSLALGAISLFPLVSYKHPHNEQGLQDAAKLEQSGHRDAVHCSEVYFEIISNAQAHEIVSRRHAAAGLCLCACLYLQGACVCVRDDLLCPDLQSCFPNSACSALIWSTS